jgi:hypothetical protein
MCGPKLIKLPNIKFNEYPFRGSRLVAKPIGAFFKLFVINGPKIPNKRLRNSKGKGKQC